MNFVVYVVKIGQRNCGMEADSSIHALISSNIKMNYSDSENAVKITLMDGKVLQFQDWKGL